MVYPANLIKFCRNLDAAGIDHVVGVLPKEDHTFFMVTSRSEGEHGSSVIAYFTRPVGSKRGVFHFCTTIPNDYYVPHYRTTTLAKAMDEYIAHGKKKETSNA